MLNPDVIFKRQALCLSKNHAFLLYDYGDTMRWSDKKNTDMPCKDYRAGIQLCFCIGSETPLSSVKVNHEGISADGRDAARIMFEGEPPKIDDDVLEWLKSNRPDLLK